MTYALNGVSGTQFNPAVTLAVAASGRDKLSSFETVAYIVAQVVGGALAGLACTAFLGSQEIERPSDDSRAFPAYGIGAWGLEVAGLCELFFTFASCYVFLTVATTRLPASQLTEHNFLFGFSVTAMAIVGGIAITSVSGGFLNPAVQIALSMEDVALSSALLASMWEIAGGLLAALVFRATHPWEFPQACDKDANDASLCIK